MNVKCFVNTEIYYSVIGFTGNRGKDYLSVVFRTQIEWFGFFSRFFLFNLTDI